MEDPKIKRLQEIADEIFDLANSYAGDETGTVACELHRAHNKIQNVLRMLREGITARDDRKNIAEWMMDTPTMLDILSRHS